MVPSNPEPSATARRIVKKRAINFALFVVASLFIGSLINSSTPTPVAYAAAEISGVVFRDANFDGIKQSGEPGVGNVTIKVYDNAGGEVGSATSAVGTGFYNASVAAAGPFRVEFSGYPSYLQPGVATASNGGTTVQFVGDGEIGGVDLALSYPLDYCQSSSPNLFTSCFVVGDQNATSDVLVSFGHDNVGAATDNGYVKPSLEAVANQVGSVWGLAYQRGSNTLFAAAFQKRHVGYGSTDSTGTIYIVPNPQDGSTAGVDVFVDLNDLYAASVPDISGVNPHPKSGVTPAIDFERDFASYDPVGKVAFGDMDISEDDRSLWAVNLADRQLYQIPLGADPANPTAPTQTSQIRQINLLDTALYASGDAPACPSNTDDLRPFAVKVHDGLVYVGMVCSGESTDGGTSGVGDLRAMAYSFDPNAASPLLTEVLNFSLDYERECGSDNINNPGCNASANWTFWEPDAATANRRVPFTNEFVYPQPMFTDIEFTLDGNMIIGLRDRYGDQMGYRLIDPVGQANRVEADGPGDILRAVPNGSGQWIANTSLPEFFGGDGFVIAPYAHNETALGGLALVPGNNEVVTTSFDPIRDYSGGIHYMDTQTATTAPTKSYEIFRTLDDPEGVQTLGKANGLGDLVALCQAAPIEIGNRVWNDANRNGVQDPGEAGINGVVVELYKDGALVGSTITANGGIYLFNDSNVNQNGATGIAPFMGTNGGNSGYEIRIAAAQTPLAGLTATEAFDAVSSPSGSFRSDSNGTLADTAVIYAIPYADLAGAGFNNHTYDFGFAPLASIGDKVWFDVNRDGVQATTGEPGVDGVTVELLDAQGIVTGTAQTTVNGGMYLFGGLTPGDYAVRFTLPDGMTWTIPNTTATTDPNADSDAVPNTDPATATTESTTLDPSEVDLTWDAGIYVDAAIELEKQVQDPIDSAVWFNADTVPVIYPPNTQAKYRFVMTNSGTSPLTGLVLNDISAGVDGCPVDFDVDLTDVGGILDPTEVVIFEPTACLSPLLTGMFTNDAIVTAIPSLADGTPAEESFGLPVGSVPPVTDEDPALVNTSQLASIGNKVWYDVNRDGVQATSGEPGVDGVTVELLNAQGTLVGTAQQTTNGGMYLFEGLTPGDYSVRFTLPGGMTWTVPNAPAITDPDADSDAVPNTNPATATTESTTLARGEIDLTWDAGIYADAAIALEKQVQDPVDAAVWYDANTTPISYMTGTQAKFRFIITNSGNAPLTGVVLDDITAGVEGCPTNFDVDLTSVGGVLDPAEVVTVEPAACLSPVLMDDFTNEATVSAIPSNSEGTPIEQAYELPTGSIPTVTDDDPALVTTMQLASIGDYTWFDADANGLQDGGEIAAAGVQVELFNSAGVSQGTMTTGADGRYLFGGLTPGGYYLVFTTPSGHIITTQDVAGTDATDSDANPTTGRTATTTLDPGENDPSWDAGFIPLGSIGDTVWIDTNGDGMLDSGENGIPNVSVKLLDDAGNVLGTMQTGIDGTYLFDNLSAGPYGVMVDDTTHPSGLGQTYDQDGLDTPHMSTLSLGIGEENLDQDFGYRSPAPAIQLDKTVYAGHDAGAGCPGSELVTGVQGDEVTYCFVVTNTGGTYLDAITVDDPDISIARPQMTLLSGTEPLAPGATLVFYYDGTLSGDLVNRATTSGNPTDENGTDIPNLPDPTDSDPAEVRQTGPGIRLDKTVYLGHDSGAGCEGTELAVDNDGADVTYCFVVTNTGDTHLNDITLTSADLGTTRADLTLLSGTEPLAPNATMVFYYETTIDGEGICTATTSGNPTDENGVDIPNLPDPSDSDPAEVAVLASIGNFVWLDTNANGIQDDKEVGVGGIKVTLYNSAGVALGTVLTDDDGAYSFDNLAPGEYFLGFELPKNFRISPQGVGNNIGLDSDVDPETNRTAPTILSPNEDDLSWDVGIHVSTSITPVPEPDGGLHRKLFLPLIN